jgi:hypothetical protein
MAKTMTEKIMYASQYPDGMYANIYDNPGLVRMCISRDKAPIKVRVYPDAKGE